MNHDNTDREIKFRFNVRGRSDSHHEVDDPPNPTFTIGTLSELSGEPPRARAIEPVQFVEVLPLFVGTFYRENAPSG